MDYCTSQTISNFVVQFGQHGSSTWIATVDYWNENWRLTHNPGRTWINSFYRLHISLSSKHIMTSAMSWQCFLALEKMVFLGMNMSILIVSLQVSLPFYRKWWYLDPLSILGPPFCGKFMPDDSLQTKIAGYFSAVMRKACKDIKPNFHQSCRHGEGCEFHREVTLFGVC